MWKAVVLVVLVFILSCSTTLSQTDQDRYLVHVLDSSLQASKGGDDRVIDTLYSSAEGSDDPNGLYVTLLDYYLGAGAGEILTGLIVQEGEQILPVLIQKLDTPLNCSNEYKQICADSIEHRNERINGMIKEIQK